MKTLRARRGHVTPALRPFLAIGAVLALLLSFVVATLPAHSAPGLHPIFHTQTNGEITVTGNALAGCASSDAACLKAQSTPLSTTSNNHYRFQNIDLDSDPTTRNSSMARAEVPAGNTVLAAYLFWSATVPSNDSVDTSVKFKAPGDTNYRTVTANATDMFTAANTPTYASYADVTSIVRRQGGGEYWAGNVSLDGGKADKYAGWALVLVLENSQLPMRDLSVFQGAVQITSKTQTVTLDGFTAPRSGTVAAKVGTVAWEGDTYLGGDQLKLNGTALGDTANPTNNFFIGSVSQNGANRTDRNPNAVSTMAVDAKTVDATNVIPNGATSARVDLTTSGDFYYVSALTTQIDIYSPDVTAVKTVKNLNGSTGAAKVGDTLEYTISMNNRGLDTARQAVLTDKLPAGLAFVPGSLRVANGSAAPRSLTDAPGDDAGELSNNVITVRPGSGATAQTGGSLPFGVDSTVTFRARVTEDAAGDTITNTAQLNYRGDTVPQTYQKRSSASVDVATLADLAVKKTGPARVTAGQKITWTVDVTNRGPSTATAVTLVDPVPAGVTGLKTQPSQGTCTAARSAAPESGDSNSASGNSASGDSASGDSASGDSAAGNSASSDETVTCELGDIPAGKKATVTFEASTPADTPAGTVFVNTATASTTTGEQNYDNNSDGVSTTVDTDADLALTKQASRASAAPGEDVEWTLTARNNGPSTATSVHLSDSVPPGLIIIGDPRVSNGSCTHDDTTVSCAVAALQPGDTVTVTVSTRVLRNWVSTDPVTNDAAVNSDTTPDSRLSNNRAKDTVTPTAPRADLALTKQLTGDTLTPGRRATYVLDVENRGPSVAHDLVVSDTLPAGLTYVSASLAGGSCTAAAGTVSCTLDQLQYGAHATVTLVVDVASNVTGTVTNTAKVTSGDTDPQPDNNTASTATPVSPQADLGIVKSSPTAQVHPGDEFNYTITVENKGPSDARGVVVSDTLPDTLSYVSASGNGVDCSADAGTVTCRAAALASGKKLSITLRALLSSDADPAELANTATVTSDTPDPVAGNNSSTTKLSTAASADLALSKAGPATVTAGERITWTLTVTNRGPSRGRDVVVTDTLPEGVVAGSASVNSPGAACAVTGQSVRCSRALLAEKASFTVKISGLVDPRAQGSELLNTAEVAAATPDPNTSNNDAQAVTQITRSADLTITKTGPAEATAGGSADWKLTVTNKGPSAVPSATVLDQLPTGVVFVSAEGADCATPAQGVSAVSCQLGALHPGDTQTVTLHTALLSNVPGDSELENTAQVSSDIPDPHPDNNTATAQTKTRVEADVTIVKKAGSESFTAGSRGLYTLTPSNRGPSDAQNVTVTDTLPDGVVPVVASGPGPCTIDGQRVSCKLGTLAAGAQAGAITVVVDVSSTAPATVKNTATVKTDTPQVRGDEPDSSTVTTPVERTADVQLTKTVDDATVHAGTGTVWNLTVVNAGPSAAARVTVTDVLAEGTTLTDVPEDCRYDSASRTVTCSLDSLDRGETRLLRLPITVAPTYSGTVENTAKVTSSTADADPSNNEDSATLTVDSYSRLFLTKTADLSAVTAGSEVTWLVTARNDGPSNARDVVITDTLPVGFTATKAVWGSQEAPCEITAQTVTCTIANMRVGQLNVKITGTVDPASLDTRMTNRASLTTTTAHPEPDPSTEHTIDVNRQADLGIVKAVTGGEIAGGDGEYRFTVTNHGPSTDPRTIIDDVLPAEITPKQPTDVPDHVNCTLDRDYRMPDGAATGGKLLCINDAPLAVGESWSLTLPFTVSPDAAGKRIENTALLSGSVPDPNTENDTSTAVITPRAHADVSVQKTLEGEAVPGREVAWNVTVSNAGPSTATDVTLTDVVPERVSRVTATGAGVDCAVADSTVTCTLARLAAGDSRQVRIAGVLAANASGDIANTASVVSGSEDPHPENNSSTANAPSQPKNTLSVAKTADRAAAKPDESVVWTVRVTNNGPSDAHAVRVTDQMDDALAAGEITAPEGVECTTAERTITCAVADLAAGSSVELSYRSTVAKDTRAATAVNSVSAVAPQPDGSSATAHDSASVKITHPAPKPVPKPVPKPTPPTPAPGDRHPGPSPLPITGAEQSGLLALTLAVLGAGLLTLCIPRRRQTRHE